ncbi:MAG: NAD-dependent epimerase/dehydratase family protein [Rubrobacteraceae bacterium]
MNWLITGGCGFLGTALIRTLMQEEGHSIRVVDNLCVGNREDLSAACQFTETASSNLKALSSNNGPSTVELVEGDILDEDLAMRAAEGVDVIVHFAANTGVAPSVADPRWDCKTNVLGTFNYLEAARQHGVDRFVFASTGAPLVGEVEPPVHEEMPVHPVPPYGASKLAGEGYCSAYFRTFGVQTVALRFGNVYGPGSTHKSSAVAKFTKRAMGGDTLEVYGDGSQTRDFIYIEDLIRAVRLAATVEGVGGETFQIATNAETSVQELIDLLLPVLAAAGIKNIEVRETEPRQGDVQRNYSDTSKAARLLGWRSETRLEDGLQRTVDWFTNA